MKEISKAEAMYLNKEKGFKFHQKIFKTYSSVPTYYCIEEPRVLKALNFYRKNTTLFSSDKSNK